MDRPPHRPRTVTSASAGRRLGVGVFVLWLCLCGEAPEGPLPGARAQGAVDGEAGAEPSADALCTIEQKKPLFVGFAPGMTLDAFEPAAQASREIWLATKRWLCDAQHAQAIAPYALTRALAQHAMLRGEEVRFDDQQFVHAHVVVVDAGRARAQHGWHVHVVHGDHGDHGDHDDHGDHGDHAWRVTHATDVALAAGAQRP